MKNADHEIYFMKFMAIYGSVVTNSIQLSIRDNNKKNTRKVDSYSASDSS